MRIVGQVFERIGTLDHGRIAAHVFLESAGLRAQFIQVRQHVGDQRLERLARLFALLAQADLPRACVAQQFAGGFHATRRDALFQRVLHRFALAACP